MSQYTTVRLTKPAADELRRLAAVLSGRLERRVSLSEALTMAAELADTHSDALPRVTRGE